MTTSGEVSREEKMALPGTDPESYITEYTSVYEENPLIRQVVSPPQQVVNLQYFHWPTRAAFAPCRQLSITPRKVISKILLDFFFF